ncbi:MAG: FAD-binding oxidoreductase [Geminicoccaceae bacterium]|nr:FAD-binding oxidoreductase [Geminicoccaceae bacterium]
MADRSPAASGLVGSLWAATAPPAPVLPVLRGPVEADVAIVGAGFTGLSTALHLAEAAPGLTTIVLEAEEPGFGASGRNNGQVIPTLTRPDPDDLVARLGPERGERFVALVRDSAAFTFALIRRLGIDCEAVQAGWIQPAHSPERFERVSRKRFEQWSRRGAEVELLEPRRLAERLGSEAWCGGWAARTGGHLNPLAFARGLARAAVARGVRLFARSPVTGLERRGTSWRLATPSGSVEARRVLLATAAYSGPPTGALARTFVPFRPWMLASEPLGENVRRSVVPGGEAVSDTRADLRFLRWTVEGRLVSGGALALPLHERARLGRRVGELLARAFPPLAGLRFAFAWTAEIALTPDRHPHLLALGPELYAWIGCNGRGVALATALGPHLAALLTGGDERALPLPLERPKPIPLAGLAAVLVRLALPYYRWLDSRP